MAVFSVALMVARCSLASEISISRAHKNAPATTKRPTAQGPAGAMAWSPQSYLGTSSRGSGADFFAGPMSRLVLTMECLSDNANSSEHGCPARMCNPLAREA